MRMSRTIRGSTQVTGPSAINVTVPGVAGSATAMSVVTSAVPQAIVRLSVASCHSIAYRTRAAGRSSA